MQTHIIPIGNSKGVRIPKALLEECGFNGKVNMFARNGRLIIEKPRRRPREGWNEAALHCHAAGDDGLLWPADMHDTFNTDWQWPTKKP